jgi:hypothetical protein
VSLTNWLCRIMGFGAWSPTRRMRRRRMLRQKDAEAWRKWAKAQKRRSNGA